MKCLRLCLLLLAVIATPAAAQPVLKDVTLSAEPEALRRGAQTVLYVCMSCHSLKYIKYRNLLELGFSPEEVDGFRGEQALSSPLLSLTPAELSVASYGIAPPDLSLMAQARAGGPRYVYTLLTSFYIDEAGNTGNHLYPGFKMPDMLGYSSASDDAQRAEIEHTVSDVVSFLVWAADPHAARRHALGYYVIAFTVVFTLLLYLNKRRVWSRLKS